MSEQPVRATLSELSCARLAYFTHNLAMYALQMNESTSQTHCSSLLCGQGIGKMNQCHGPIVSSVVWPGYWVLLQLILPTVCWEYVVYI